MVSSLFKSFHEQYPDHDLYVGVDPKFAEVFLGNPYVKKVIAYHQIMESELAMVGQGKNPGYVDVYFHPAIGTQRQLDYLSNDKIAHKLLGDELKIT